MLQTDVEFIAISPALADWQQYRTKLAEKRSFYEHIVLFLGMAANPSPKLLSCRISICYREAYFQEYWNCNVIRHIWCIVFPAVPFTHLYKHKGIWY
jgi:hypothetical protein